MLSKTGVVKNSWYGEVQGEAFGDYIYQFMS